MSREELDELEQAACPGPGTCAGQFTANTMAVALDCLESPGSATGLVPAVELDAKQEAAARAAAAAIRLAEEGITAWRFLDRRAPPCHDGDRRHRRLDERRPAPVAIAREARTALLLDELAEVGERTRYLQPRALGPLHGDRLLARRRNGRPPPGALRGGLADGSAPTVSGETPAECPPRRPRPTATCSTASTRRSGRRVRSTRPRQPRPGRVPREGGRRGAAGAAWLRAFFESEEGLRRRRASRARRSGRGARRPVRARRAALGCEMLSVTSSVVEQGSATWSHWSRTAASRAPRAG